MTLSRLLPLALIASLGCSDDDTPDTTLDGAIDGSVDSGVRDGGLDAQSHDASACDGGAYASGQGCRAWADCLPGYYVSAPGTATSDRMCLGCPEGTFSSVNNALQCTAR